MSEDVRVLFRQLAGHPTAYRADHYAQHGVSATIQREIESLLNYDTPTLSHEIAGAVEAAAHEFLMANAPASEGGRCGPYLLTRILGHGGMGSVYLAERADGEVRQQVAIKFMRGGPDAPSFRERFLKERQILASMNHPAIARLLDAGHSGGHPYLVMEYVDGVRIDKYAEGRDIPAVLAIFIKVAEAVSYAHRNLVVHRDLKPSNILVDSEGQPKLLDFGIAKILDNTDETRTLERAMTPDYASPEQMSGAARTTATDVYSLGAVLHRLLMGRTPRAPVPVDGVTRKAPADLVAILAKATRDEPGERYDSADALIADLEAYLDHRPVRARKGNAWYLARKFLRRRWLPVTAVALASAGIAVGVVVADQERAVSERRSQEVRQLSQRILTLDAEIRSLPGSTKARNDLITASAGYLERLSSEARPRRWGMRSMTDLNLSLEIAEAYLQVARIQGVPMGPSMGQFQEAKKSLARAASFTDGVLAAPNFPQRKRALLRSAEIAHHSMILEETEKNVAGALELAGRSASQLDEAMAMGATREDAVTGARLYSNIALVYSNRHLFEQAAMYARRAADLSRRMGLVGRELSRALGVLSNAARSSGDFEGALAAIRESRNIAENWARPDNVESMLQLSSAHWREGLILGEFDDLSLDRADEALPLLKKAFDIADEQVRKDSHDYTSRSYLNMAGRELGDVLRGRDPARALEIYDYTRSRLNEIKGNVKARREQVQLLAGSSYALRSLHREREARERIDAAFVVLREVRDLPAKAVEPGGEADSAMRALGDHYAALGQVSDAVRTYEELHDKVEASNPQPMTDLRHANALTRVYRALAILYRDAGRAADGAAMDRRRDELWRFWDRKLPNNSYVLRQLSRKLDAKFSFHFRFVE